MNRWFDVPTTQMLKFLLFISAGVLFNPIQDRGRGKGEGKKDTPTSFSWFSFAEVQR